MAACSRWAMRAIYSLPGDLSAVALIPEIVHMGIAGLKIEGRYKDETYVALTTPAYRKAVDDACGDRRLQNPDRLSH
jgi:collagenase-like PrtC family protease